MSAQRSLQEELKEIDLKFNLIKESTIQCFIKCHIDVMTVVCFSMKKMQLQNPEVIPYYDNYWTLFETYKDYCNPFSYHILDQLIQKFMPNHATFKTVHAEMAVYKKRMEEFRKQTPLDLFCKTLNSSKANVCSLPEIESIAREYQWPMTVTLQDVEDFRNRFSLLIHFETLTVQLNLLKLTRYNKYGMCC